MPDQTDNQTERARELRGTMQSSQRNLWNALRSLQADGIRFRRETPIGKYIADIYCHAARLIVEVDGQSHIARADLDAVRDAGLAALGIKALRIRASEIQDNVDVIARWIVDECKRRIGEGAGLSPSPLARQSRRGPLPKGEEINATTPTGSHHKVEETNAPTSPVPSPPGRGPCRGRGPEHGVREI